VVDPVFVNTTKRGQDVLIAEVEIFVSMNGLKRTAVNVEDLFSVNTGKEKVFAKNVVVPHCVNMGDKSIFAVTATILYVTCVQSSRSSQLQQSS
jgi:hypothetical protein